MRLNTVLKINKFGVHSLLELMAAVNTAVQLHHDSVFNVLNPPEHRVSMVLTQLPTQTLFELILQLKMCVYILVENIIVCFFCKRFRLL